MGDVTTVLRKADELLSSADRYTTESSALGRWWRCEPTSGFARRWSLEGAMDRSIESMNLSPIERLNLRSSVHYRIGTMLVFFGMNRDMENFYKTASFDLVKKILKQALK